MRHRVSKNILTQITLFILCLFLSACARNKKLKEGYYFEDFDSLHFWNHETAVTRESAHSGDYAAFTDSSHEFSQAFEMENRYALSKGFKSLSVQGWCRKATSDARGLFIVSVESAGNKIASAQADLSSVKEEDWEKVCMDLQLPEKAPEDSKIKIALWSPEKDKLFLDDVEIAFKK